MTKNRFPAFRFVAQRVLPALAVAALTGVVDGAGFRCRRSRAVQPPTGLENLYKDVLPAL